MRLEDDVVLEPQEICDLTNYVLGYSVAEKSSRRIEVFVVKTWQVSTGTECNAGVRRFCDFRECWRVEKFRCVMAGRRPSDLIDATERDSLVLRFHRGSSQNGGRRREDLLRWRWGEKFSRAQAHIKDQDGAYSQGQQGTQHA